MTTTQAMKAIDDVNLAAMDADDTRARELWAALPVEYRAAALVKMEASADGYETVAVRLRQFASVVRRPDIA